MGEKEKIKLYFSGDEWFPVWHLATTTDHEEDNRIVEIPIELFERWKVSRAEFLAVQRELGKITGYGSV